MSSRLKIVLAVLFALFSVATLTVAAEPAPPEAQPAAEPAAEPKQDVQKGQPAGEPKQDAKKGLFLRLARDAQERPTALQAAIVHCVPKDKSKKAPTVDLVSAVHVGEKNYYRQLNREFRKYDVVLYELVAPQGTKIPKGGGGGSGSPVSALQMGMKDMLELEFQLEAVNYTRKNFVHADMSPEQFRKSMEERNESVFKMALRMFGYAIAKQAADPGGSSDAELLMALFAKDRAQAMKRVMAEQFQDMEGSLMALEGPDGSTLISARNDVALGVLRKQIAAGKKNIAIFYGAGHMPHFAQRLREDFDLVPASTRWLDAWDLEK